MERLIENKKLINLLDLMKETTCFYLLENIRTLISMELLFIIKTSIYLPNLNLNYTICE